MSLWRRPKILGFIFINPRGCSPAGSVFELGTLYPRMFSPSHPRYQHSFAVFFCQETSNASPVILRVDPQGFYVYWTYQSTVSAEAEQLGLQPASSGLCEITTLQVLESCTWEQTATLIPLSRDTPPRVRAAQWQVGLHSTRKVQELKM